MDNIKEKIKKNLILINKIPRGSGDEENISDYLKDYAINRNLEVYQDDLYNLIIKKKSTIKDYNGPTVILQGHMDMVYVKDNDSNHKYNDVIGITEENGFLYSLNGTSLGGDNGVALAYFMILMDTNAIIHPDLEIIITVQEEIGLVGANNIDASDLNGKYLINLDAENEGVFFVSCAGGVRNEIIISNEKENNPFRKGLEVTIEGLKGGHSGLEINENRGNAIILMARLINTIIKTTDISVSIIKCDGKANAIPNKCSANIWCDDIDSLNKIIHSVEQLFSNELNPKDTISIHTNDISEKEISKVLKKDTLLNIVHTILLKPNGVINMDNSINDLVETSVNIGSLDMDFDKTVLLSSIRSSVESKKEEQMNKIKILSKLLNNEVKFYNNYPGWQYSPNSKLRDIAKGCYEELTGKQPQESAIHAGLECGYFNNKIKNLDIISFGPNLYNVHTPNERLDLQSSVISFKLILEILKKICY